MVVNSSISMTAILSNTRLGRNFLHVKNALAYYITPECMYPSTELKKRKRIKRLWGTQNRWDRQKMLTTFFAIVFQIFWQKNFIKLFTNFNVGRFVTQLLLTYLVGWQTSDVSLPPSDVILAQLACPLSDVMFRLHSGHSIIVIVCLA